MQMFNYAKLLGAFIDGQQTVSLSVSPSDRGEKKMLEEANALVAKGWERKLAYLNDRLAKDPEATFDEAAEKQAFFPVVTGDKVAMPLQYVQDYMVKKMAAIQNNTSIHNTKEVEELKEVFNDYGVKWTSKLEGLVFDHLSWSARQGQKPKLLVHSKSASEEPVVIRFEAAGELCHKFMHAVLGLELTPGTVFSVEVEAVDPAIARNKKAGKKVAELGKFVNHNLTVTLESGKSHTGKPADGKFVQKMTIEQLEALFQQARNVTEREMI